MGECKRYIHRKYKLRITFPELLGLFKDWLLGIRTELTMLEEIDSSHPLWDKAPYTRVTIVSKDPWKFDI